MMSQREGKGPALPTPLARPATRRRSRRLAGIDQAIRRHWLLYALILPSLLSTVALYYYPMASGVFHSFTYWDIKQTIWIGLDNYRRILDDPVSVAAWRNMALILAAQVVIVVTTPLLVAALIAHLPPGRVQYVWRLIFVAPMVVPVTVTIFIWRWFYAVDGGLNQVLSLIGLDALRHVWLGDQATALWAIIFVGFPWIGGLNFLIYLAALQAIPAELLDAARVDGAGPLRRFFLVELPLIRNQMLVLVVLTFIYYLRSFDAPLIMTNGGPGMSGTLVPGLQMYRAVREDLDLGYGSAIGTVLFVATILLTLLHFAITRRQARQA